MNRPIKFYFGSYNGDQRLVLMKNPRRQYPDKKIWEFDHKNPNHIALDYGFLDTSVFVGNHNNGYADLTHSSYQHLINGGVVAHLTSTPHPWQVNLHGVVVGWDRLFISPEQVYTHVRALIRRKVDNKDNQKDIWDWVFNNISIKLIEVDLQVQAATSPSASWKDATPKNITKIKV